MQGTFSVTAGAAGYDFQVNSACYPCIEKLASCVSTKLGDLRTRRVHEAWSRVRTRAELTRRAHGGGY
jgi:hypothetical protein